MTKITAYLEPELQNLEKNRSSRLVKAADGRLWLLAQKASQIAADERRHFISQRVSTSVIAADVAGPDHLYPSL